ncbi:armadillo repeat-containing protein 10 [Spea bombifrons]|uniref:armadillo repeat-containing protein 10 n=1 Tax=Spea bombifrons TaxID=233779 RepID=UPI00234A7EEA|nr:armadillo repeat-containing protein 10 [Spea bombifrons]
MLSGGTVMRQALYLAVGAAVCYLFYRVTFPNKEKKKKEPRKNKERKHSKLVDKVSEIAVLSSFSHNGPAQPENIANPSSNLEPYHFERLLEIVGASSDSCLREQALITLANSAAFSVNQDIIRNLNGIEIIGAALSDHSPQIQTNALNALSNLSVNVCNQELIKDFIAVTYVTLSSVEVNSQLQLSGLRLLINMSVTNNYQDRMTDYIPFFLHLLVEGNADTQIHVLKILVNLSANPSMATCLLQSEAPQSLDALFSSSVKEDILLRALTFAANLYDNVKDARHLGCHDYDEKSLFNLLFGDEAPFKKNLWLLLQHPDMEVKEKVATLL